MNPRVVSTFLNPSPLRAILKPVNYLKCSVGSKSTQDYNVLARFVPASGPRPRPSNDLLYRLRVYPEGLPLLDDILMSILIIERNRLTPSPTMNRVSKLK